MRFVVIAFGLLIAGATSAQEPPSTFSGAKKYLADLHESIGHQTTLYCGCPYERTTRSGGDVDREEKSDTQTNKCDEASIIHRNRPRWWTGGDR